MSTTNNVFLSTPSGWRATAQGGFPPKPLNFYPRPPGGGRQLYIVSPPLPDEDSISIHALRVEGDPPSVWDDATHRYFYPRPPGGGRRVREVTYLDKKDFISIHALRVEGDSLRSINGTRRECRKFLRGFYPRPPGGGRRVRLAGEGITIFGWEGDFYPRPPGGGDVFTCNCIRSVLKKQGGSFLSTPSGWRATVFTCNCIRSVFSFLSTPSGWRATEVDASKGFVTRFLSTPSGWRATDNDNDRLRAI